MVPIRRTAGNWLTYLACGGLVLAWYVSNKPKQSSGGQVDPAQNENRPFYGEQPSRAFLPPLHDGWHAEEREHHRKERGFWRASIIVTATCCGRSRSKRRARLEMRSATGKRPSSSIGVKRTSLTVSWLPLRARRLKLTAITGAYVSRTSGTDVAWFNFRATGQELRTIARPANVSFVPHIFIDGAGPSPKEACRNGAGWTISTPAGNIRFSSRRRRWRLDRSASSSPETQGGGRQSSCRPAVRAGLHGDCRLLALSLQRGHLRDGLRG